jgi:hypothetical protein
VNYVLGKPYPFPSRDELLDQMYSLRSKFTDYASYATASIDQVLSKNQLKDATILKANYMSSVFLHHKGNKLESIALLLKHNLLQ